MAGYRTTGGMDDALVTDGDVGFIGVNTRLPAWQLPPGMLSLSENGRIDGAWTPRKGVDVVAEGSLSEGSPLRLPFWVVDTSGGLTVSAASRVDELVTLTVTGHGLPVSGANASVIVNPSGADNSILYEAVASGAAGELISIEYETPDPTKSESVITVDESAITVIPGDHPRMQISGVLSPDYTGDVKYVSDFYGYTTDGEPFAPDIGTQVIIRNVPILSGVPPFEEIGREWAIYSVVDGFIISERWASSDDVDSPDLVTTWTPRDGATGTPVVTAIPASAQFVIEAINDDPVASLLVTASASGTVTGQVAAVGPVFLQGASGVSSYLGLESVTGSPTVDPVGNWMMTPTDADTLEFEIPGATGSESYTVTTAKVRSVLDDFSTGEVLAACIFSDPSDANAESVFLAYGSEVKQLMLSDGSVTSLGLPGVETLDGEINMIQAMDKVFIFRAGLVAMQWQVGDTDFSLVTSGVYAQPQVFSVTGTFVDVTSGLCVLTGLSNTTVALGDTVRIYGSTDPHFTDYVGDDFYVTAASGTSFSFYIPIENLTTIGANTLSIGKRVSVGGGFIHQPGFPWAIYFQRRLWGPYHYDWDTSLTPDAFTDREIRDELIAGDILDPDTFDPITNQFRITGGTADRIVALHPFFDDTLLILNRNSIHAISGTVGSLLDASVRELTREIGCLARKSVVSQGNSVFFLSDNGVYGLAFADQYNLRGVERPLSENIQPCIDRISQEFAAGAVGIYHNNRYWLAVPLDSSPREGDAVGNNAVLVYNLLNREWESVDMFGDPNFYVTEFLIGSAESRNDLYAVSSTGGIHVFDKLDEDHDRIATNASFGTTEYPISAQLRTRAMLGSTLERKRFTSLGVQMRSGTAQSDIGVSFSTEDPDSPSGETLASATMGGFLDASDSADVRVRVGGQRGFNGAITIRRVVGRPEIQGTKLSATVTNRATLTQI